jgi:hypothetical protein
VDPEERFDFRATRVAREGRRCEDCGAFFPPGGTAVQLVRGPEELPRPTFSLLFCSRNHLGTWAQQQGLNFTNTRRAQPAAWSRRAEANEQLEAAYFDLFEAAVRPNPVCEFCPKGSTTQVTFWGSEGDSNPTGRTRRYACREHLARLEDEVAKVPELQGQENRDLIPS